MSNDICNSIRNNGWDGVSPPAPLAQQPIAWPTFHLSSSIILLRIFFVVFLFALIEANVFEQYDFAVGHFNAVAAARAVAAADAAVSVALATNRTAADGVGNRSGPRAAIHSF